MELQSRQALEHDIATVNAEVARLTTVRNRLIEALRAISDERQPPAEPIGSGPAPVMMGDRITTPTPRDHQVAATKRKPTPYDAKQLRDMILEQWKHTDFTVTELAKAAHRDGTTIKKYLNQLEVRGIVVKAGKRRARGSTQGTPAQAYKYNREFPENPKVRPTEKPPETELIGATPIRTGQVKQLRKLKSKSPIVQSCIDAALGRGWTVEAKDAKGGETGHIKFTTISGRTYHCSLNPPTRDVASQIRTDLRRLGLVALQPETKGQAG